MSIKINNPNRVKRVINNLITILMVVIGAVIGSRLAITMSDLNTEILNLKTSVKELTLENEILKNKLNNRFGISEFKDDLFNFKFKNMIKTALACTLLIGAGVVMSKYGFPSVDGGGGAGGRVPRLNIQSINTTNFGDYFTREFWFRSQPAYSPPPHLDSPPSHEEVGNFVGRPLMDNDLNAHGSPSGEPQFGPVTTTGSGFSYQTNPPQSSPRTPHSTS